MIIFIYLKNVFFFLFQEKALTVFRLAYEKAVALGYKLDIIFLIIKFASACFTLTMTLSQGT